jgi:hypothetical protein
MVQDLKSIEIYSGTHVNALQFNLLNQTSFVFGNKVFSYGSKPVIMYRLELENKRIIGIQIRSGSFLDSLKFILEDVKMNLISSTPSLGGEGGYLHILDSKLSTGFKEITRFIGTTTNQNYIRSIRFEYSSSINHGILFFTRKIYYMF